MRVTSVVSRRLRTGLPSLASARQRLAGVGLPLRVILENDGAGRDVITDRRRQIDSAERAEIVAPSEEVGAHLGDSIPTRTRCAMRHFVVSADRDQAAPFVVGQWIPNATLQADGMDQPVAAGDRVFNLPDTLPAHTTEQGGRRRSWRSMVGSRLVWCGQRGQRRGVTR
jgi:hypothetical protein